MKLALVAAAAPLGACALQPYALISTATHPGAYPRPPANADLAKEAVVLSTSAAGEACSRNLLGVYAWGDASIAAAVRDALAKSRSTAGDATMLVNVKIDHHVVTVLGLYGEFCTQVAGVAFK